MNFKRFMDFVKLPTEWVDYMKNHKIKDWMARVFVAFILLFVIIFNIACILLSKEFDGKIVLYSWIAANMVFLGMGVECYINSKESLWRTACRGMGGIVNGIYAGYVVSIDKNVIFLSVYQSLPDWFREKPLTMDNYMSYIYNNEMIPDHSILPVAKSLFSKQSFGVGDMVYMIARKKDIKRVYKIQDPRTYVHDKKLLKKSLCFKRECIILPEHIPMDKC